MNRVLKLILQLIIHVGVLFMCCSWLLLDIKQAGYFYITWLWISSAVLLVGFIGTVIIISSGEEIIVKTNSRALRFIGLVSYITQIVLLIFFGHIGYAFLNIFSVLVTTFMAMVVRTEQEG